VRSGGSGGDNTPGAKRSLSETPIPDFRLPVGFIGHLVRRKTECVPAPLGKVCVTIPDPKPSWLEKNKTRVTTTGTTGAGGAGGATYGHKKKRNWTMTIVILLVIAAICVVLWMTIGEEKEPDASGDSS